MKYILFIALLFSTSFSTSFAANLVTNPASSAANTVSPSAAGVVGLTLDNSSSSSSEEFNLHIISHSSGNAAVFCESTDWDCLAGDSVNGAGAYGYSEYFVGIYGESGNGNAGYFALNSSLNNHPTLIIQDRYDLGSSLHMLELQNSANSPVMSVDANGLEMVKGGLQLSTSGSKPSCNSGNRGLQWLVQGAAGVADLFQVCMKDAANNYAWVTK